LPWVRSSRLGPKEHPPPQSPKTNPQARITAGPGRWNRFMAMDPGTQPRLSRRGSRRRINGSLADTRLVSRAPPRYSVGSIIVLRIVPTLTAASIPAYSPQFAGNEVCPQLAEGYVAESTHALDSAPQEIPARKTGDFSVQSLPTGEALSGRVR